jgi:hypothetical protein
MTEASGVPRRGLGQPEFEALDHWGENPEGYGIVAVAL